MPAEGDIPTSPNRPTPSSSSSAVPLVIPSMPALPKGLSPLLLHFDVNKTVIQSDSIQNKKIEEGIREGIAELFWGRVRRDGDKQFWEPLRCKPCCHPPQISGGEDKDSKVVNYAQFCKLVLKDKEERKEAIKSFRLVVDEETKQEMDKLLQVTKKKMELSPEVRFTSHAAEAGLQGSTLMMFPTVFQCVAALQRSKRTFAILFRSFGMDHEKIAHEWNAFCEMRHPLFSNLIAGVGPMDGTVPGIPDRRIHGLHTLYRDAEGPMLILDCITNGPPDASWDQWVKANPKPKSDTRNGRDFVEKVLKAETVEGFPKVQNWMRQHLLQQRTAAIKDDWAWWQWHNERAEAGKLLTVLGDKDETHQLFFDDNVDCADARIVDCRDMNGEAIPAEQSINRFCTKVNPVEALLDDEYFLRKLQDCHGEHLDVGGHSLIDFQKQLTECEEARTSLSRMVDALQSQVRTLTEENRRMKLLHRIAVRDEAQLRDQLSQEFDLETFGKDGRRTVSDLFKELEDGHCWLEQNENGNIIRIFEMVFIRIQFKDTILVESHEQEEANGRIQRRNYLPGVRKAVQDSSFQEPLEQFFASGMQVDLRGCVRLDTAPVYTPEAPIQQTFATQAYPIPCKVQMSEATYTIPEKVLETNKELLAKIGLPGGKHFTTTDKELYGGTVTRIWRWDKEVTFEATVSQLAQGENKGVPDIAKVFDQLFRGHPHREVYEKLLLQMFETCTAKKLCGGFSGSVVIRVQPYESNGRPGEPCIVKLDTGEAIREESINSRNVFKALPDRAAQILCDPVYACNKDDVEFGAMRLELAGACWNVPELAQGSGNLLTTFKDLLNYESEQILLGRAASGLGGERPFGNVHSIIAETFGPGGITTTLRKGSNGVRRTEKHPLCWGWYSLKGKESTFNPYTAKGKYPPENAMRRLYRKYFNAEMPDLKELVVNKIKPELEQLAETTRGSLELFPLVGLAHGDLNAANIMIDALDAVWLIDFATSIDLPLFTDMCKFEMACLFEYATIPIVPLLLVDFATMQKDMWKTLNIGDWLRVDQDIAEDLLRELVKLPYERLANITQDELNGLIDHVAGNSGREPSKQRLIIRALRARLTVSETEMDTAFEYCASVSKALLQGDYIFDSLNVKSVTMPDGDLGAARSLMYFMDICCSVRRFTSREILSCLKEHKSISANQEAAPLRRCYGLQPCDALSLQLWLPFLRETYRLIGYRDVPPQHKIWSIYHCNIVAENVLRIITTLNENMHCLSTLRVAQQLQDDWGTRNKQKSEMPDSFRREFFRECRDPFSDADSHWILAHREVFTSSSPHSKTVRREHAKCPFYGKRPGFFAPIYKGWVTGQEDRMAVRLTFDPNGAQPPHPWTLTLPDLDKDEARRGALVDPELQGGILGTASVSGNLLEVTLKSRLFFLTTLFLKRNLRQISKTQLEEQTHHSNDSGEHSEDIDKSRARARRHTSSVSAMVLKPTREVMNKLMTLHAVAQDSTGREMMKVDILLGGAVPCYPGGSSLCPTEACRLGRVALAPTVVVIGLNENGVYSVRDAQDAKHDNHKEFDPTCVNHVCLAQCLYKKGQRLVCAEEHNSWVDAVVLEEACEGTGWRHRLLVTVGSAKTSSWGADAAELLVKRGDSEGDGADRHKAEVELKIKEEAEEADQSHKVLRHLSNMNSGPPWLPAAVYEDEVHKMKVYLRARHSFIMDALSGQRLDVKSCALPTLHIASRGGGGARTGEQADIRQSSKECRSQMVTPTLSTGHASPAAHRTKFSIQARTMSTKMSLAALVEGGSFGQDTKAGWQTICNAVDSYEKAMPTCSHNAFLVLGSPGSGKTCLVCRLIMDCLDRQRDLVPVLLPVSDLVKRTDQEQDVEGMKDMDSAAVHAWFDKYLRITFGEDSQRYKMVRQAISMHRVLFLFEGIEDVGPLEKVLESLVRGLVKDRHLVVLTSRPMLSGQTWLEDMSEYVTTMVLQHLTEEQKRSIARSRLGRDGLRAFDDFFRRLRQGKLTEGGRKIESGQADEEEVPESSQEDVFGNPMMLSMLICYLQPHHQGIERDGERPADQQGDSVTLTAVYRVAIEVMLQRVQSRQQEHRHNKFEKVGQWMRILEKMAMAMQEQKRVEIDCADFERMLSPELKKAWQGMKTAVEAGHAMFLRTSKEGGRLELRFLVKGFQNFFAASEICNDGGKKLPRLKQLLEDRWWADMLEMLAEGWSMKYVKLVESHLERYKAEQNDETFLHLAAQVGHKPVFQLLRLFSEQNQAAIKARRAGTLWMPLHVAAEQGNTQICNLLVEQRASMDAEDANNCIPLHVALKYKHFATAKFLLDKWTEQQDGKANKNKLKPARHTQKDNSAERLASQILGPNPTLTEAQFKEALKESFIELNFFGAADMADEKREIGSLLSIFWITTNNYEHFIRGQAADKLSPRSWESLQEWTRNKVGLTNSPESVGAMLTFMAIMNLGKIRAFKKVFAPDYDQHYEALASILQKHPILIPSFSKLDERLQHIIISTLKADFNFGQLIQAENLPARLFSVKEILGEDQVREGENNVTVLGFWLFVIFAAMCGLFYKGEDGATFMTEQKYNNFKVGLDVLHYLTKESAQDVYNRFLAERALPQELYFHARDMESRALVRLACLCRTFTAGEAKAVSDAFVAMSPKDRSALIDYLNADGIAQQGFLLFGSPTFLENARLNPRIGLMHALPKLLQMYTEADHMFSNSDAQVVTIMVSEIATFAKECEDPEVFDFTKFEITRTAGHSDSQGMLRLSPWTLWNNMDKLRQLTEDADKFMYDNVIDKGISMREPAFLKKLPQVFPELHYLEGSEDSVRQIHRQTLGALLVVYWVTRDHCDTFTRGQPSERKLSESSWAYLQNWISEMMIPEECEIDIVTSVFIIVMLSALGRVARFRAQLAPEAKTPRQAIKHVLDTCPEVLPSYHRLEPTYKRLVRECLTRNFNFDQFQHAESLPANITSIKDMLRAVGHEEPLYSDYRYDQDELGMTVYLSVLLFSVFAEVSGSQGPESLEGSPMTDEHFLRFKACKEALQLLEEGKDEWAVYDRLLASYAESCSLPFDANDQEQRAVARLACLAQCTDVGANDISEAFKALDPKDRIALTRHLNADGIHEQPAFILFDSPAFLESARTNTKVGLAPAMRILLGVYEKAAMEFRDSNQAIVIVQLGKLAALAKEFFGSVAFQDLPLKLHREDDQEAIVIPKVWIPVHNTSLLESLKNQAMGLAGDLLKKRISEDNFKDRISQIFPELSYFNTAEYHEKRDQTFGAMLSVYWLITGQHEAFIREQKQDCQLSRQSWAWIQEWMAGTVKLSTEEALDATLVFMAIHALGKITEFRDELVSGPSLDAHMHDIALALILETKPEVVPSFMRLSKKYRDLIVDSLRVDLQFSQFLQAEATPANLVVMKEKLKPHRDEGFSFFCFRIFVQMCGKHGQKSLKCSLFMDEPQFQRFRPGLDALQQLRSMDAAQAYNSFLLLRGSKAMSRFASPEHQALARLLCLGSAYDTSGGHSICDAFDELTDKERRELTQWLNSDGISHQPGYVLCDAPAVLQNAKVNRAVGLASALRMLIKVQRKLAAAPAAENFSSNVAIHLGNLADWAKDAGGEHCDFLKARVTLRFEGQGETRAVTVDVERPDMMQVQPSMESEWEPGAAEVVAAELAEISLVEISQPPAMQLVPDRRARTVWIVSTLFFTALAAVFLSLALTAGTMGLPGAGPHNGPAVFAFGLLVVVAAVALGRLIYVAQDVFERRVPPYICEEARDMMVLDIFSLNPRHEYSRLQQEDEEML